MPSNSVGAPLKRTIAPQPMVAQIRTVLARYEQAGGRVRTEMFAGSGHGPHVDAAERWLAVATEFWGSTATS